MKNIKWIGLLLCLGFVLSINAQQLPRYSEYMFDKAIINPAYTGTIPYINSTLAYRKQFTGIEGAPTTQFLTFHAPIQKKNIGLGLKVVNDKVATIATTSFAGMFSYYIGLGNGRLSVGLEAGLINQKIDFTNLVRHDAVDNAISANTQNKMVPDASVGLYYQTKSFFIGWSSFQLIKSELNFTPDYGRSLVSRLWNHNYVVVGGNFGKNEDLRFEPSMLIKHVSPVPIQIDLNAKALIKQLIAVGATYRVNEAIVAMVELQIKDQFRIGYAFDYTTSKLASYQNGTHEILFTYRKKLLPPARDKEIHPRYYIY
ncbi:MAG: type IX secretion system membrane protein PorP/SprF [Bacteroidetes bacterium]|nr:type IX secretion system membrane protein PorP/SprF [Bacteroidota bacterium]